MFMHISELFELCWPSSLSIKLIKVGPIVSDGGLQVGSGGPGSRGVTSHQYEVSPLSPSPSNNPPAPGNVCGDGDTLWGKQNRKVLR